MAQTMVRGTQILDHTVQRDDLDTSTVGNAVIAKIIQGTNVTLSSTGADSGTGDVTISVPGGGTGPQGLPAYTLTTASFTVPAIGSTTTVTVQSAAFANVGDFVSVTGAGGSSQSAVLQITAIAGNTLTLLNPPQSGNIPPASSSTAGLLNVLSGVSTDYVGGDNASHGLAAGVRSTVGNASASQSGLLAQTSGATTDYVGGDNACHALASAVVPLSKYFGTDTGTAAALAVTVNSDFQLITGATVYVVPANMCAASPTLNVNGTGAKAIVNRANIALNANEIVVNKMIGVMYDGTSWRVITPIKRLYYSGVSISPTIECGGYDSVEFVINATTSAALVIALAHLEHGIPIHLRISNGYSAAITYQITCTTPDGVAHSVQICFSNTTAGAGGIVISTTGQSLTNGLHIVLNGMLDAAGTVFFK